MDAFSWFRQKRRGLRPQVETRLAIPVASSLTVGLVVYFRVDPAGDSGPPKEAEMRQYLRDWLDEYCGDPLRSAIESFLRQDLLSLMVRPREHLPEPPDEMLRAYNPGETEERRFRNATHAVLIGTPELLSPPRIGLWTAFAAARALAMKLPGSVIIDPIFPRLLGLDIAVEPLPADGYIRLVDHILIPYSVDPSTGLAWITTKGMDRFGLPELEIRDAPPNLVNALMPVMNGLAQRIAVAAMEFVMENGEDEPPESLIFPAQLWFTLADIRRAYAHSGEPRDDDEQLEQEGASLVRLELAKGRSNSRDTEDEPFTDVFLRLVPPHGVRNDPGIWLNRLLTDLFGSDPQIASVETGDAAMEAAHQEALRELPRARDRFLAGFRSGEVLHVKYGFPTEGDGHEYMWIVVTGWEDERVFGFIANDPQYRRDLAAGQAVEIGEDEIYDWLIVHTDGRTEGAYTNRALGDDSDDDTGDEDE